MLLGRSLNSCPLIRRPTFLSSFSVPLLRERDALDYDADPAESSCTNAANSVELLFYRVERECLCDPPDKSGDTGCVYVALICIER